MDFLEQIFQELLTEEARTVDVVDAIKKRYEAKITYKADNDPKGSGERIIQPVAYGTTKAGNPVIRAFEPYGDTKTKVPAWKFFRLDRITSWKALRQNKFSEPPADQWRMSGAEGKFNESGDETMAEVFLVADFKGTKARYERGGLAKYNANRTARKKQDNPLHDFERNIEKSISLFDLLKRENVDYEKLSTAFELPELNAEEREQVEITSNYEGYIRRQLDQVAHMEKLESKRIPEDIDYMDVPNLRDEAREKLADIRPVSLGQAGRISGVSPADVSVLMVYLEAKKREKEAAE